MKIILLIDYLGFIAVKIASLFFRSIPVSLGLWLARGAGRFIYYVNRKRRAIAYRNLKAAFGHEKSQEDIKRIIKKMYQNLMQTLVEVLTFPRIKKAYVDKFLTIEGMENLEEARSRGKGIIFLTGHFGNWEFSGIASAVLGYRMLVLAREQKHSLLNDLLNQYRELTGGKVIKKGFAIRDILSALHNNDIIAMLVDQDAGKGGVFVDFFGRKTSTVHGPMRFALKTGATILPAFIIRQKGPYHKAVIGKPLRIEKTQNIEADIKNGLQGFAAILEAYVKKYPEQWLWVHKRWKSTPTKKILVLDDGRAGHLNQSIAVAETIQRYRKGVGYATQDTSYSIVGVKFKNKLLRYLFNIGAAFAGKRCLICAGCLKLCLTKSSYEKLMSEYADIIISCGASLEGVNLLMSKELGAKNILLMKPSVVSACRFSLVIAPKHDKLKKAANVVITEGAPTRITEEKLKKDSSTLAGQINLEKEIRIGAFIGGDNPEFRLTPKIINELIDSLIEIACQIDADILLTTSRRTSKEIESVLKRRLSQHMRCKLLVIANERNVKEAVSGILGLCQIVVVSYESISMVSEALNSSNYTFVFELERKKKGILKHELFLNNLAKEGFIELVKTNELFNRITEVWDSKPSIKKLNDESEIYKAIERIL